MKPLREQYVVDEKGNRVAVLLDGADDQRLLMDVLSQDPRHRAAGT